MPSSYGKAIVFRIWISNDKHLVITDMRWFCELKYQIVSSSQHYVAVEHIVMRPGCNYK